jgi:hypothetical protein
LIYIKFFHRANIRGKYADGFYDFMISDTDGIIPAPVMIFTCTALRHALLEWKKTCGAPPKVKRSKLDTPGKPDPSKYFNYKNDGGMAHCFPR